MTILALSGISSECKIWPVPQQLLLYGCSEVGCLELRYATLSWWYTKKLIMLWTETLLRDPCGHPHGVSDCLLELIGTTSFCAVILTSFRSSPPSSGTSPYFQTKPRTTTRAQRATTPTDCGSRQADASCLLIKPKACTMWGFHSHGDTPIAGWVVSW